MPDETNDNEDSEMNKMRKWLETTTGTPKTEKEAKWFLVFWYGRSFSELTSKDVAWVLQSFCNNGISYESIQEEFFDQMSYDAEEGNEEMARETREFAVNFYQR